MDYRKKLQPKPKTPETPPSIMLTIYNVFGKRVGHVNESATSHDFGRNKDLMQFYPHKSIFKYKLLASKWIRTPCSSMPYNMTV